MTKANNFEPLDIEGENTCKGKKSQLQTKFSFALKLNNCVDLC
jgi:hypothetical protein